MEHKYHVAVLSICPDPAENNYRADNLVYIGTSRRDVWKQTKEMFEENEANDGTFGPRDTWVLSFDVWVDFDDQKPPSEDDDAYDTWYAPEDRWDMLQDIVGQDSSWLGDHRRGPYSQEDNETNSLWIAEYLLGDDVVATYDHNVCGAECTTYVAWRSALYPSHTLRHTG